MIVDQQTSIQKLNCNITQTNMSTKVWLNDNDLYHETQAVTTCGEQTNIPISEETEVIIQFNLQKKWSIES